MANGEMTVYTPPEWAQIKTCAVDFDSRALAAPVHLVQYDRTMPVLEVALYRKGEPYAVPAGADINIRMDKKDGHHIYSPALGLSADRTKAYIAVTPQMTTTAGTLYPIIEVMANGGVASTSPLRLQFDPNPVPEDAITSSDEYKTLEQIVADVNNAAAAAQNSAAAAKNSEAAAAKSAADAREIKDSMPADYTAMSGDVGTLKNQMQLAYPNNTAPTDATWSARKTLDVLCDEVTASGNPVELEDVCEVEAVASWEPVQAGSGDPSPDNVRAIKGRSSVAVICCGENLLNIPDFELNVDTGNRVTRYTLKQPVPVGDYTLCCLVSNPASGLGAQLFFDDGNRISVNLARIASFTANSPLVSIYFYITNKAGNKTTAKNFMLVRGDTAPDEFIPYVGQANTLTLPETVYGGSVDAGSGEGQETWKMLTLDGTEPWRELHDWSIGGRVAYRLMNAYIGAQIALNSPAICSHFPTAKYVAATNTVSLSGSCICKGTTSFTVVLDDASLKTVDEWKTYLAEQYSAGSPIQVAFTKETITSITATGAQPLPAIAGLNTVLTNADMLAVTAKKAPLVRLGELRKEYEATVGELETAQRDIRVLKKLSKGQVWDFETKTEDAYEQQVPAGAYAAGVQEFGGHTVAWNKLTSVSVLRFGSPRRCTVEATSGEFVLTVTDNTGYIYTSIVVNESYAYLIANHIYGLFYKAKSTASYNSVTVLRGQEAGITSNSHTELTTEYRRIVTIMKQTGNAAYVTYAPYYGACEVGQKFYVKDIELVDLTLMFGTGNEPTTTDDPRIAWIEQYAAAHPEYNAGELVSAEVDEVQFNGVAGGVVPSAVQELPGYGWSAGTAKNTVERTADGKWQYVQRVGKVELDGTESLNYYNPIEKGLVATIICMPEVMPKEVIGFCSRYKFVKNSVWSGETENCVFFSGDKTLGLSLDLSTATSFGFDGTKGTIPKTVKAMLETYKSRGTPLSITYPLNTPIVTDITDLMGADALNFEVEPGGSITMHNAAELSVPATIQYVEKLSEVVSND